MTVSSIEFGSTAWADEVFSLPPARKVKGRTRWTHRHVGWVEHLRRLAYVESRNELVALIALDYLHRQGRITRFKEQPFTTDLAEFGYTYTPDFLAETPSAQRYVIEIKTERFISRSLLADLDKRKEDFSRHGLKYLVWTDHEPLIHPLRHNLQILRRASTLQVTPEEISRLTDLMAEHHTLPVWKLVERNVDLDLITHACWHGKVFIPITQPLSELSEVSLSPQEDLTARLLSAEPDLHAFWNGLEDAA